MRAYWLFAVFFSCGLWATDQEIPEPTIIRQVVQSLGSEDYAERENAKSKLETWSNKFPRFVLSTLATEYAEQTDLEIQYQLEILLKDLGEEVLFYQPKAFLGVNFELSMLPDGREGIRLQNVIQGSPADQAGLRTGDYLLEVGGTRVSDYDDTNSFAVQVQQQLPLNPLRLRVLRLEKEFEVDVILAVKKDMPHNLNLRLKEEEDKIENWLTSLRPAKAESTEEPVGDFRMD